MSLSVDIVWGAGVASGISMNEERKARKGSVSTVQYQQLTFLPFSLSEFPARACNGNRIDYLTVNENSLQPPNNEDKDSINSQKKLSIEATMINQNFSQQVLLRGAGAFRGAKNKVQRKETATKARGASSFGFSKMAQSSKKDSSPLPARKTFEGENPFWDNEDDHEEGKEPAAVCYRYRKWDLGDGNVVVARTELHGIQRKKGQVRHSTILT